MVELVTALESFTHTRAETGNGSPWIRIAEKTKISGNAPTLILAAMNPKAGKEATSSTSSSPHLLLVHRLELSTVKHGNLTPTAGAHAPLPSRPAPPALLAVAGGRGARKRGIGINVLRGRG